MRGKKEGDWARLFRRRRNQSPSAKRAINATTPTPAPIPAFAPVDKPLLLDEDMDAGVDAVGDAVLVDVLNAAGKATDEKPGLLTIGPCWLNENLCPF